MSDEPPLRRPPTARPRRDPAADQPAPPTVEELRAIERQLSELWRLAGASLTEVPDLEARLVTWPGRGLAFNQVVEPRWSAASWQQRLEAAADRLRAAGELPSVAFVDELVEPLDLAERMRSVGWLEVGQESLMWTRRAAVVPHLDPGLRVEAVSPPRAAAYERLEREIFGLDAAEAADRTAALEAGLAGGRLRAYLLRLGGEPIATARLIGGPDVAALQGIGVVAGRRRQGYGTLVTTIATRAGLATGHQLVWLAVDPANLAARTLYAGLDYRPVATWRRLILTGRS